MMKYVIRLFRSSSAVILGHGGGREEGVTDIGVHYTLCGRRREHTTNVHTVHLYNKYYTAGVYACFSKSCIHAEPPILVRPTTTDKTTRFKDAKQNITTSLLLDYQKSRRKKKFKDISPTRKTMRWPVSYWGDTSSHILTLINICIRAIIVCHGRECIEHTTSLIYTLWTIKHKHTRAHI